MKTTLKTFGALLAIGIVPGVAGAQESAALRGLPVKEVTVFKDGHAFVLREGNLPVNGAGEVVLDGVPTPVVGTFWPYAVGRKLADVTASRQEVSTPHAALSLADLIRANVGAEITMIESDGKRYDAKILSVPQAPLEDILPMAPTDERYRMGGFEQRQTSDAIVMLGTKDGVLVRSLSSLGQVIFKTPPAQTLAVPQFKNLLRLRLEDAPAPSRKVQVGMVYLQKGIRWIPSYYVTLGANGTAAVKMQATLADELVDLDRATVNLVIGVPSFAFKDVVDPIGLRNDVARLSSLFETGTRSANAYSNANSNNFSNQSQSGSYTLSNDATAPTGGLGSGQNEDFYVFPVPNVTLKKGERQTFGLAVYTLPYSDIYTSDNEAVPPADVYRTFDYSQQAAINAKPTSVMHKLRITNNGTQPLTTAPALIEKGGRLLAQTSMTYTATGGRCDIELAPAIDITLARRESEVKRTANAISLRGSQYSRVDVEGTLTLTSFRAQDSQMEVSQQFLGTINRVGLSGTMRKLGVGDDTTKSTPSWWNSLSGELHAANGLSVAKWSVKVPAKHKVEIPYAYSYFVQ